MKLFSKITANGVTCARVLLLGLSAMNADAGIIADTLNPSTTPATVTTSAAAGTFAMSTTLYPANQSAGSVTVKVNRAGGSTGSVTVRIATADGTAVSGTNYTAGRVTLTWKSGDTASKSFSVKLSTAQPYSGRKSFLVQLSLPAGGAAIGSPNAATVTVTGSSTTTTTSGAARLAALLGRPGRLLVGLGHANNPSDIISQRLKPDIYDRYLSNQGPGSWTTWNSPAGAYVGIVANEADSVGAVPMYTLYQMATNGEGNLGSVNDSQFMTTYWANVKLLFQKIAEYNKPALVNFEPDFWGFVERQAPNADPALVPAKVSFDADCTSLPNNATGIAACLVRKARKYAPKAYVGFPPSDWGGDTAAQVVTFMNKLGAGSADFVVMQTLDRDAGCFEASGPNCSRAGTFYWDESNATHPNFHDHLATAKAYHNGIGGLPLLWWQTPLGVPSSSRGGSSGRYRDNRMHYFLTHAGELTAAGALGVVFGAGEDHQTTIRTDNGQFQTLSAQYLARPAPLP